MPLNAGIMSSQVSGGGETWPPDCDGDMKHDYSSEKYGNEDYSCYA